MIPVSAGSEKWLRFPIDQSAVPPLSSLEVFAVSSISIAFASASTCLKTTK